MAEAGTEFHEWAAAQLDPSNNKQGKIDGENKDEIAKSRSFSCFQMAGPRGIRR